MTTKAHNTTSPHDTNGPFTVPGLTLDEGHAVGELLQHRLHALNDLALTLKHVHWNVIGPDFIGVHEMLDPQIEAVRTMVDDIAERMAALGVAPVGTPGALVGARSWDDYSIGRANTIEHLGALDVVYDGVVSDQRDVIKKIGDLDPITEDLLIGQTRNLEQFQWFIRAHLERRDGSLASAGATHEGDAAARAAQATRGQSSLGRRPSAREREPVEVDDVGPGSHRPDDHPDVIVEEDAQPCEGRHHR